MKEHNENLQTLSRITVIILLFSVLGCQSKQRNKTEVEAVPVEVQTTSLTTVDNTLSLSGNIDPIAMSNVGSPISGKIEKIYVKEGDFVKQGDLIVQMNDAQLEQAKLKYQLSKLDYDRMSKLYEEHVITQQQFDQVKTVYENDKTAYEFMLSSTQIRAPLSGVVTSKYLNDGEMFILFPGQLGSPAIVTIMQISRIKVTVAVPENYLPLIKLGQKATLTVDPYPGKIFEGSIARINPALNKNTRTFLVEIHVPNPKLELRPGMLASVKLYLGKIRTILVPPDAVLKVPGSNIEYAYVINGNKAQRREVQTGKYFNDMLSVTTGLNPDEKLVVVGQTNIKDGTIVKISQTH
ncbi:MAG: efflux RND transporter periplasmic adaptor subunit [Candidatus Kryptoniota bacterium]